MRYRALTAAFFAVLGGAGLAGCGAHKNAQMGPPPLNVDVAQAVRRNIATYATLDGQVTPLQNSTLSVQQAGPLIGVYANEGDRVSAGQLLAKVDDSTFRAQLAQDEALIAQSQAKAQSSSLSVPITEKQVSNATSSAQAALNNAKLVYDQNVQLYKQGFVSQTALENSRSAYEAALAQYNTAVGNEENTQVQSANAAADRAAIASAQAQANALRTQIRQTSLYAPFDGIITARLMDPGAMAGPTQAVFQISQVDTVYVNLNVPDEDLEFIHAGTPVTFTSSSISGKTFAGRIFDVNAVPTQGTLSYRARIRLGNPGNELRGGMLVTATIVKQQHAGAIVIPRSAVGQTERGTTVFVVQGNKAKEVPVTIGLQTDTLSEVRSPQIGPGTTVITTRPDALQNGSVVAVNGGQSAH
ncbi:MAG: efflux RND transporter periplasmic adaptor subunit [Candidatus Eremiobacteraeota bacterium]|nr:efflux RND transporter periplasmic adaptor subunit [Candidatus Eremiobacteraeota bacterium]